MTINPLQNDFSGYDAPFVACIQEKLMAIIKQKLLVLLFRLAFVYKERFRRLAE